MLEYQTTLLRVDLDRIKLAMEINCNAALAMSQEGKIVTVNKHILSTFGYEEQEVVGQNIEMLVPERYRGRHVHHRNGFFKEPSARLMSGSRSERSPKKWFGIPDRNRVKAIRYPRRYHSNGHRC